MFKTHKRGRVAAALAVAAGLLLTTATTASAETIDPGRFGTLTITKLADPGGDLTEGDGMPADIPPGAHGLPGVTFRIRKVPGVNLSTENGWQLASNMTVEDALAAVDNALPVPPNIDRTETTDDDGVATFTDLPVGLYLVTEEGVPPNVIASGIPFLVTVPMTDPVNLDNWVYDVNVYPKNSDTSVTKTVDDTDAAFLGDYVWFDVTMAAPRGATSMTLTDKLDPRLEFVLQNGDFFWITGAGDPEPVLVDYEYLLGEVSYVDGVLTVTFDEQFLADHVGDSVGFRIRAKVVGTLGPDGETVGIDDGWITNQAQYIVNSPNGVVTEGESNPVVTKWGTIQVNKINEGKEPLEGAEFCLVKDEQRARDGECDLAGGVTDPNGNVSFIVRYSDWAENAVAAPPQSYWLVETKAPKTEDVTYELMAEPLEVKLLEADGGIKVYEVVNYPHNAGFDLPVIGGNRAVLPIVAAVIAAGGVVWLIRSRREQQA